MALSSTKFPQVFMRGRHVKKALPWLLIALVLFMYWFIPPVWKLRGGYTTVVQWRRLGGEQHVDVGPKKPGWIAANSVSRHVLYAFIAAEDMRFKTHHGLDWQEILSSLKLNIKRKAYVRGGSTITQQVVKMATLSRDKSVIRKAREAVGALLLEQLLTKNEILEWYINLAEFGDGIYGLRAAAKHYFQTKPELLTISQATHLALVLPSPNGWSVGLRRRNLTDFGHRRFYAIVTRMKLAGYVTETQWLNTLASGNFGMPIKAYEKILAKQRANEQEDVNQQEDSLGLNLDDISEDELLNEDEADEHISHDETPKQTEAVQD